MADDRVSEYRDKADECRQEADRALGEEEKAVWLSMAERWLRLANEADRFPPGSQFEADKVLDQLRSESGNLPNPSSSKVTNKSGS